MEKTTRERKEELMKYILNNVEGIKNLYRNKKELHVCSAEGHVTHIYSNRMKCGMENRECEQYEQVKITARR